jgi:hypothetical protein
MSNMPNCGPTAEASGEADPIFAAIERHRAAFRIWRRRQQLSDDGEAQVRPPLVTSGTSCLLCHAGAPLAESSNRKSSTGWLATSVLCGYGTAVIERACGPQ